MSPEEQSLFEQSLTDLDVFITGFQKQARGPNGERFAEPLERLKLIKKNLIKLQKRGTKRFQKNKKDQSVTESSAILNRIEETSQNQLQVLRSDIKSLSNSTGHLKSGLKRLEGLEKQLFSIGQSTMDAAGKVTSMMKHMQAQAAAQGSESVPEKVDVLAEQMSKAFRDFQTKLIGMARGVNNIDRKVREETDLVVDLTETVERRFTSMENKITELTEKLDISALSAQLKKISASASSSESAEASTDSDQAKPEASEVSRMLNQIVDRISAIDSLSMVLHPLSNSYQQLSNGLDLRDRAEQERSQAIMAELKAIREVLEAGKEPAQESPVSADETEETEEDGTPSKDEEVKDKP